MSFVFSFIVYSLLFVVAYCLTSAVLTMAMSWLDTDTDD